MIATRFSLDNGLRLVCIPQPHLHVCEVACYVGVGSRHEPEEVAGISHFLEHMLFRGSSDYPDSLTMERAFEALGGNANASTDAETTCYYSRFHPDHVVEGTGLFASLLLRPLFAGIETERRIILEEALEDLNEKGVMINPDTLTGRLLWPGHTLSQPTIGTADSLRRIDVAALQAWHRQHYTPANTVIVFAGSFDPAAARQAVEDAFADWQGEAAAPPTPVQPLVNASGVQSVWVADSSSQVNVQLALRIPGRSDPDAFALRIWRRLLSWGGTSRLMLRLREELGLTYHVEAGLNLLGDTGCLSVDLSLHPDNFIAGLREVLLILGAMRSAPVPVDELQRCLRSFSYDLEFSRDHADEMAVRYGWGELVGYKHSVEEDLAAAARLTSADLQAAACRLLTTDQLTAAIVGPWRKRDRREGERLLRDLVWS